MISLWHHMRRLGTTAMMAVVLAVVLLVACNENPVLAPDISPQYSGGKGHGHDKEEEEDDEEEENDDKGNHGGNKSKVIVTPAHANLRVGDTKQLRAKTKGKCDKKNSSVTWQSSKPSVATVSPSGKVTAVGPGRAEVTATCGKKKDSAIIVVRPAKDGHGGGSGGTGGVADPTLLPEANRQTPQQGTYGRTLVAGQTYEDPNTGVTVLKMTDAVSPAPNAFMDHGYSEGGPTISQAWIGASGRTFYTLRVGQWLVDLDYAAMTSTSTVSPLSNWRPILAQGEISLAFSLNPATPRIAYVITDAQTKIVNRYNTATNLIENTGNWPWIVSTTAPGTFMDWLQTNLNDTWFVGLLKSDDPVVGNTVVAFRPSDGLQQDFTEAETGTKHDEPHIDRQLPYVYISTNNDDKQNVTGFLETGATRVPNNSVRQSDDHEAPLRGMVTGLSNFTLDTNYYYDVLADLTTEYTAADNVIGLPGDWHMAGQWVMPNTGNGTGPGQWFEIDPWGVADPGAAIQTGFIGIVRPSPFSARLLAAHDSQVDARYETQPQTTFAPDGKLAMWTSNMGGQPRTDVFLAKLPVR